MAQDIFPLAVWTSQITQASIPANDNAIRLQAALDAAIGFATAQPGSPAEDDQYVLEGTPTGAQWADFDEGDIVIFKGGTWLSFLPFEGMVKTIAGSVYAYGTTWDPASAATTFLGLTDTPSSYTGQAGKLAAVNGTEDGLEFIPAPSASGPPAVEAVTASETLAAGRAGKFLECDHATVAIVLTVPTNASVPFAVGTEIHLRQAGVAAVSVAAAGGVTITRPASQTLAIAEQYGVATLKKVATDSWALFGMLGATP